MYFVLPVRTKETTIMNIYPDLYMMGSHRMMFQHGMIDRMMFQHGMMGGQGMYPMMPWLPGGLLLFLVLLLGISWLVMLRLSYQNHAPVMWYSAAQPQDTYHPYEQGYMSRQPATETYETYREGERDYPSDQPDQEHSHGLMELEYPQQELPWQQ